MIRIVSNTNFYSLGPDDWSLGKLIPNNTKAIPTVTDNLFEQGKIGQKLIAVSFEPTTSLLVRNGELTFGGVDATKFTGDITYVYVCTAT
jgi:cathepsin E